MKDNTTVWNVIINSLFIGLLDSYKVLTTIFKVAEIKID